MSNYLVVRPGDIVFNKLRTWQGGLGVSRYQGVVSPAYFVCRPVEDTDSRYYHYLLRSKLYLAELTRLSKFMPPSQFDIAWDDLRTMSVLVPPLETQRAIADYLDAETARIDALITKKRRMIELLTSRGLEMARVALTLGQTYGDPLAVSLRDGFPPGVEPFKLSWLATFGGGTTPSTANEAFYDGPIPWVLTGDLDDREITTTSRTVTRRALTEHSALQLHPPGSLIVAMYGATIGKLGILEISACTNQACCVISVNKRLEVGFLFHYLRAFRSELIDLGRGSGQPNISQGTIRSIRIPLPALFAQESIVSEIESDEQVRRTSVVKLTTQIDLLAERRQALITAAVTGELEIPEVAA
jgi:type I restriction enzyme S subunit